MTEQTALPSFIDVLNWSDKQCRDYLVRMRWPDGIKCPKCGSAEPYTITRKTKTKNKVRSFYKCRKCKRQFSATVGTIFEDSKIPLQKWFAGIYLMCSSKKGIRAHQLHRMLGITYKSAWFMCHRVREATKNASPEQLSGIIEADETYMGGRRRRGHNLYHERLKDEVEMGIRTKPKKPPYQEKTAVFGMVERDGEVRSMVVPKATGRYLGLLPET